MVVADCCSSTFQLLVPPYRLSTIGRLSFTAAASAIWNSLPVHVQSSPSISIFGQRANVCTETASYNVHAIKPTL